MPVRKLARGGAVKTKLSTSSTSLGDSPSKHLKAIPPLDITQLKPWIQAMRTQCTVNLVTRREVEPTQLYAPQDG